MCPILDGYGVMGVFKFPYTPLCEPRLSAGRSLFLASCRHGRSVIKTLGRGKAGAVHNRAAAYVVAGGGIFENHL